MRVNGHRSHAWYRIRPHRASPFGAERGYWVEYSIDKIKYIGPGMLQQMQPQVATIGDLAEITTAAVLAAPPGSDPVVVVRDLVGGFTLNPEHVSAQTDISLGQSTAWPLMHWST